MNHSDELRKKPLLLRAGLRSPSGLTRGTMRAGKIDEIITLLTEIRDLLKPRSNSVAKTNVSGINILVRTYIDAWRIAHGVTSKPQVGKKEIGIFQRMAKERPIEELVQLIQIYTQMKNTFFFQRKHDVATFEAQLNNVIVARDKGYEVEKEKSWMDLVAEEEQKNGQATLPGANTETENGVAKLLR